MSSRKADTQTPLKRWTSSASMPTPPDLQETLAQLTQEGFRPAGLGVAIVFCLFIAFNLLDLPPHAVVPVVIHDVCMVLLSLALLWGTVNRRIPLRWTFPLGAAFVLTIQSNILLTSALLREPFYTFYVGIILIGGASLILSTRWVIIFGIATILAWAPIAALGATPKQYAHYAFTMLAAGAASIVLHINRIRTQTRVVQLRYQDQVRELQLEEALELAELRKQDLDRKVEERTAELARAYEELQRELDGRHQLEQQRTALEGTLRQAQKMESVGRLAGGVAHDFNNLLTILSGNISLARRRVADDPKTVALLDEAQSGAERAADLTRQLLAFSRRQILRPETIRLSWVLHGIQKILQRVAAERVSLELVLDDEGVGNVFADQGQIEQVVVNLAINACDAMPDGGTLHISLQDVRFSEAQCRTYKTARPGRFAAIVVRDTGLGMDEETRATVFEPFFTTKDVGKGTGLGLAVVDGIVTQHGGFIELTSAPGEGSCFTVCFPVTEESAQARLRRASTPIALGSETGTILVAEDEEPVRELTRKILELHGYEVLVASDGRHALELADAHDGPIDLLLTDVIMPRMDGPELAGALTAKRPDTVVLYMSGYSEDRIATHGVLEEGVRFLQKPYTEESLVSRIRSLLRHRE